MYPLDDNLQGNHHMNHHVYHLAMIPAGTNWIANPHCIIIFARNRTSKDYKKEKLLLLCNTFIAKNRTSKDYEIRRKIGLKLGMSFSMQASRNRIKL